VLKVRRPTLERREPFVDSEWANLRVLETWKGNAKITAVVVPYDGFAMCPPPPHFRAGKRVLAFLFRDKGGSYRAWYAPYSTLYPTDDDVMPLRARVDEAIALQSDPLVSDADHIDWILRAAAHPGTRWQGLEGLRPVYEESRPLPPGNKPGLRLADRMQLAQRARLKQLFLEDQEVEHNLLSYLDALQEDPSFELTQAAARALDQVMAGPRPNTWVLDEALGYILPRVGDQHVMVLAAYSLAEEDLKKLKSIWQSAKKRHPEALASPR
jgi:hypothetical protein